jgi:DNA-binding SARP family transcriptional activator
MTARRYILIRLVGLLGIVVCPLAIVLLLQIRPPLPTLPRTLSSPITLELVQGALDLAAWAAAVALAALLFAHALRALFARKPVSPAWAARIAPRPRPRPLAQERLAAGARQGGFPPPFPLILSPRPMPELEPERTLDPAPALATVTARSSITEAVVRAPGTSIPELPAPSIALLGPLTVAGPEPQAKRLFSRTQELLAYLALHPEGATGDELVAALATDIDDEQERMRIWRAVSQARGRLGEVIRRVDERYYLDRDAMAIDLDRFEELVNAANAADDLERERLLEQALALVRGQPLAGSDFAWAAGELRRLRGMIVDLLEELGYLRLESGHATGALAAAEQGIALDGCNESAHRLAMQAESALGLRQAIVERYELLSRELENKLGLEPERETRLLYRRLLSQDPAKALPQ